MTSPTADEKYLPPGVRRITRRTIVAGVFLFALFTPAHLPAQKLDASREPKVRIQASTTIVNNCPDDESAARVRLKAVVDNADCVARYTWSATAGRRIGEGPEVVWDFNGTPPGYTPYDVTLTVEFKSGCGTRRAVSAPARVIVWGCSRVNVVEVYGCTDACLIEQARTPEPARTPEMDRTPTPDTPQQPPAPQLLTLHASVRNAHDGSPVPRAKISFFLGGESVGEAEADELGRFLREGLRPGTYRLVARADKFDEIESIINLDRFSSGPVVLSLNPARIPPTPPPPPTPSPAPSPTASPSPEASPTPSPSRSDAGSVMRRQADEPTVPPKGWSWVPWLLGLAAVAAGGGVAYMLLNGGGAAGSLAGGAGAGEAATGTIGATESSLAGGVMKQSDKVYCTVFAPKSAPPAAKFITQVFAHLKEQEAELDALAQKCVGDTAERFVSSKRMGREIERDTEIFFRLEMEGLEVEEPEQTLFWDGVIDSVTFKVKVPDDFKPGEVPSNVIFGVVNDAGERVNIGHVNFMFEVAAAAAAASPPAVAAPERPAQTLVEHKRAFISYASEDRDVVMNIVRGIMSNGTECFMDKMTFKPGEDWAAAITRLIEQSDVFYLFWSQRASKSEWVQKEIDFALEKLREHKARPLIQPMPLEGTAVVAPPKKLRHMHFDDPTLDHIDAQKYRQSLRQQSSQQN